MNDGNEIYFLARRLWPICRSITGDGVRKSLSILQEYLPGLAIQEIPSGAQCFDWQVPPEWNISDAYIIGPDGTKIVDFNRNNLHVVGYSLPVDLELDLEQLQNHLHSLPEQPNAIPYVTSYYSPRWGFCISEAQRKTLIAGKYRVKIDSQLKPGAMTYGELILPGHTDREVLISTYICHPSMANNELSGPSVTTYVARWLMSRTRRYTYRIVFIPETIGSICYISRHLDHLRTHVDAGYVLTCIGDDRSYSFLSSRAGTTLADKAALHCFKHGAEGFKKYSFLDRGSDERQYCSPGVDLPVASIMRSKYGEYPEYHTSLDDLTLISPSGLQGGYEIVCKTIGIIEANRIPLSTVLCEPQLGRRGLYPTLSAKNSAKIVKAMTNLIAYADGKRDLLDIADLVGEPFWTLDEICSRLEGDNLLQCRLATADNTNFSPSG